MRAATPVVQHYVPGAFVARRLQLLRALVAAQQFGYAVAEREHGFAEIRGGRGAQEGRG